MFNMTSIKNILLIAMLVTLVTGQRPSFAGSRPIGFPEVMKTTTEGLGNRFGEDGTPTTTVRLPLEANGDKDLVDRLSKLPIDQQPFWLINWQALEEHRKNPQTFEQKPNVFVDPMPSSQQQAPQKQSFQQQQPTFQQQQPTFQPQQPTFQKQPTTFQQQPTFQQQSTASEQQQSTLQQQQQNLQQQQQNLQKPQPTQQVLTMKEFQDLQRMTYLQYLETQRNQQNNNQVKKT